MKYLRTALHCIDVAVILTWGAAAAIWIAITPDDTIQAELPDEPAPEPLTFDAATLSEVTAAEMRAAIVARCMCQDALTDETLAAVVEAWGASS